MTFFEIVEIAGPAAIFALATGPRLAAAFFLAMDALVVFGLSFWAASQQGVWAATANAARSAPLFLEAAATAAVAIALGSATKAWLAAKRASLMTDED